MLHEVKIAVIGAGRIGRMHAQIFARTPGAEVVGIVERCPRNDWRSKARLDAVRIYSDAAGALANNDTNAVVIATSTDAHIELIRASLAANKKVFCEKPIAFNSEAIEALAREAGNALVQVGFNRRFDPQFARLAKMLRSNHLGRVFLYHIVNRDPHRPPLNYIPRSGGMFTDFNVHDFDMLRFLSDSEIVDVYARAANLVDASIGRAGDVDTAVLSLQLANGALATIDTCRETNCGYDQRAEALGEKGTLRADNVLCDTVIGGTMEGHLAANPLPDFVARYQRSFELQAEAFVAAARGEAECTVGLADAVATVRVAEAAWQSVAENRPQRL